jgi:hypothetical protein
MVPASAARTVQPLFPLLAILCRQQARTHQRSDSFPLKVSLSLGWLFQTVMQFGLAADRRGWWGRFQLVPEFPHRQNSHTD